MPRRKRSNSPFELLDDDFDDRSSQSSRNDNPPIQRNAANARERARMRVLSSAFGRLKTKLPNIPADTKLSKLDTLRLATMYIKQLKSVVEGGGPHHHSDTNGDILEGSTSNSDNALTNCYLNLNSATQSMNWPFGFHHQHHLQHLTTTNATRLNTANSSSMAFINATNSSTPSNWCPNENNNNNEQSKYLRHQSEHQKQQQQQQQQYQNHSFMQHTTLDQQHNHHWYSETPSPELDSTSSPCLTYENIQLVNQQEHHQHQQQHHHHRHHHVLTHLQPASIHSSSTFHATHNFLDHSQHRSQHQNEQQHLQRHQTSSHHLSNGFENSANFQSTSIR